MAKTLTDEARKLRLELIDLAKQGVNTQVASGYYNEDQLAELTKQLQRVAKYLNVAN